VITVFVYGALMDTKHARQNGRRAAVPDHAVKFVLRGLPLLEPRFLGLIEAPGEVAHGVVFDIEPEAWDSMTRHERGYVCRTVTARADDDDVEATAFLLAPGRASSEGVPSARYATRLLRGAELHGLPPDVVETYRTFARTGPRLTTWLRVLLPPVRALSPVIGPGPAAVLVFGSLVGGAVWLGVQVAGLLLGL
jgi:hypothetical protein